MTGLPAGNISYTTADGSFHFHHHRDETPDARRFKPHYEKGYEIYLFISGSGSYTIEGNKYELEPYSLLMMNPNELHVLHISEHHPYERIVLVVNESFLPPFMLNGIDFFRTLKFRSPGRNNQLKADWVKQSGLPEMLEKLQHLLEPGNAENEFVAKCIAVQILAAINRIAEKSAPKNHRRTDSKIGALLEFINANLDQPLSLDRLAERFYITKYHLCRTFKEATGFSINQYITYKRIRLADGLMLEGHSPTQACFMAGFNCYSNFFKAYRKLTGRSPRSTKGKQG